MNTMACTAMACGGTIASHHCLVRHQNRATKSTHAPMMNSVVPMADRTAVTAFNVSVRCVTNHSLTAASPGRLFSGPVMRNPTPTMTSHRPTAGRSTRWAKSRHASLRVGAEVSSS